ncbi:GHKL domain-containing protein [Bifidobacterium catenulatum]|nr:GHKL domain-containing protein [Bifidobacterium catenulatum]MDB6909801.1 GHKL domain-containing protein [Bifidobacterium catenulatum]
MKWNGPFVVYWETRQCPVSTKHGGTGLGSETIRGTAGRNHGTATFDYGDGVFQVSVMLCLDD